MVSIRTVTLALILTSSTAALAQSDVADAAMQRDNAAVRRLLQTGADVNAGQADGATALHWAAYHGDAELAEAVLEAGANPDKWDIYGRNPLYTAVDYNTLPHGGRADRLSGDLTTPLEIAELVLAKGGNANLQLKLFPPYRALGADRGADGLLRTGVTSLFRAARGGDIPMLELLLKHGALTELPSEEGVTPLIVAAGFRQSAIDTRGRFRNEAQALEATRILLEAGADPNITENNGQTAIFGAATQGWNSVVQLLADKGADLEHKDTNGNGPIDAAMGRAGAFGRGSGGDLHVETAALIEKLIAQ